MGIDSLPLWKDEAFSRFNLNLLQVLSTADQQHKTVVCNKICYPCHWFANTS